MAGSRSAGRASSMLLHWKPLPATGACLESFATQAALRGERLKAGL